MKPKTPIAASLSTDGLGKPSSFAVMAQMIRDGGEDGEQLVKSLVARDTAQCRKIALLEKALDNLALALTDHNHLWSREQRKMYEEAMADMPNLEVERR